MLDVPATGWSKTPTGAVDWEKAFEDPEAGLIAMIQKARTPAALRGCMIVVIRMTYARKDDPAEVDRFVAELINLIPDNLPPKNMPRIADMMIGVLRQIKVDRIEKVREFEANAATAGQEKDKPIEDRRSKAPHAKPAALTKMAVARRKRKALLTVAGIAGSIVLAGIFISTYMAGAPKRELKRMTAQLVEQMHAVNRGENINTHVFGGNLRTTRVGDHWAVAVEGLSFNQCVNTAWSFAFKGNILVNGVRPTKSSAAALSVLCANSPENSTVTWIPRSEDGQKDPKARKK